MLAPVAVLADRSPVDYQLASGLRFASCGRETRRHRYYCRREPVTQQLRVRPAVARQPCACERRRARVRYRRSGGTGVRARGRRRIASSWTSASCSGGRARSVARAAAEVAPQFESLSSERPPLIFRSSCRSCSSPMIFEKMTTYVTFNYTFLTEFTHLSASWAAGCDLVDSGGPNDGAEMPPRSFTATLPPPSPDGGVAAASDVSVWEPAHAERTFRWTERPRAVMIFEIASCRVDREQRAWRARLGAGGSRARPSEAPYVSEDGDRMCE